MERKICIALDPLEERHRAAIRETAEALGLTPCFLPEHPEDPASLLADCEVLYTGNAALLSAAPAQAEKLYMGKRQGKHSASQEEISQTLIDLARAGKTVARLKGGDPFVFGRGGEELLALNPGYDIAVLHAGDQLTISNAVPYLTVVAVERQNYIRDLPYTITYRDDASMYQGDTKVLSKGVYGKADVTANVTIINGEETAREYVASVTLSQPVAEVQARGTKVRPTWFPTGSFRWPCYGVITSYFGPRRASVAGASTYHEALDIANSYGTAIYAADGGTVTLAGWYGGLGYCVKIDHGNGFVTTYGHNSSLLVSVGQHVYKGQQIARMGSTGISTGSHCHFGVYVNGTAVDPLNYL